MLNSSSPFLGCVATNKVLWLPSIDCSRELRAPCPDATRTDVPAKVCPSSCFLACARCKCQCPIRTVGSQPNTQEEDAVSILGDGMCMGILERRWPSCDIWAPISLWAPTGPHPPILILTLTHFLNLTLHFKYVKLDFSFSDSYIFGIRVSRVYYANPCK